MTIGTQAYRYLYIMCLDSVYFDWRLLAVSSSRLTWTRFLIPPPASGYITTLEIPRWRYYY
jgi:hypothetical protein